MDGLIIHEIGSEEEFLGVSILAKRIWEEHFSTILPVDQVTYMVQTFQSAEAIKHAVEDEEYHYYRMDFFKNPVGYFAIKKDGRRLFLSKLYIEKSSRGKGFSSAALIFIKQVCRQEGLSHIWLTVNRNNFHTIEIYQHFGFIVFKECKTDIGGGYVKDDYFMELPV